MVGQKPCGVKILPARLNTCSTGADVVGTENLPCKLSKNGILSLL